jgi:hypothetical protein
MTGAQRAQTHFQISLFGRQEVPCTSHVYTEDSNKAIKKANGWFRDVEFRGCLDFIAAQESGDDKDHQKNVGSATQQLSHVFSIPQH